MSTTLFCGCVLDKFDQKIDICITHSYTEEDINVEGQTIVDKEHKDYGKKYDEGKPMIGLIAPEAIWEEAQVMTFGAKKYGEYNWTKGLKVVRVLSAGMRHILQFLMGEDNDKETGLSHLAHARCCMAMAMWTVKHRKEWDDRPNLK